MTRPSATYRAIGTGNSSTRTWSFSPIIIFADDELEVVVRVIASGVETAITQGTGSTNYAINIAAGTYPATGSIEYPAAGGTLLPSTSQIIIRHKLDLKQEMDLSRGVYDPAVQEEQADKFAAQDQQQHGILDRSMRASMGTPSTTIMELPPLITGETYPRLKSDLTGFEMVALSSSSLTVNAANWQFVFDSSTTMADPGTGEVRLNNATLSSVTQLAFDAVTNDTDNPDISDYMVTWDDSTNSALRGTIVMRVKGSLGTFVVFSVTGAVTDNTGWLQVPVAHVDSNGTIAAGDTLLTHFTRTGDAGADGAGSGTVVSAGSSTDLAIVRYDGTTGDLVADSAVFVDDADLMYGMGGKINAQTDNYQVVLADMGKIVTLDNGSAKTLTVPENTTLTLPEGFHCLLVNKGAGIFTVAKEGSDTILSKGSNLALAAQGSSAYLLKLSSGAPNAWYLVGDLA